MKKKKVELKVKLLELEYLRELIYTKSVIQLEMQKKYLDSLIIEQKKKMNIG